MTDPRIGHDRRISVVSIEDEDVLQYALQTVIEKEGWAFTATQDLETFRTALSTAQPTVAIVDLRLPGGTADGSSTLDLLQEIPAISPSTKRLVFTAFPTAGNVRRAFAARVEGFVQKRGTSPSEFLDIVRRIAKGGRYYDTELVEEFLRLPGVEALGPVGSLTEREQEVLRLVLTEGLGNKTIADRLNIGVETVKAHLKNATEKLGPGTRMEKAIRAKQFGML